MNRRSPKIPRCSESAFTLVELLVAVVLASAVLIVAAIAFGSFVSGPRSDPARVTIFLEEGDMSALFGIEGESISVAAAPSYGARVFADEMRDQFWADVRRASAVFCLGREGRNTLHPVTIPISGSGRDVDSPSAFLGLLSAAGAFPGAADIFTDYRNVSSAPNGSIFILQPSSDYGALSVRAIYDIDLLPVANPQGVYAVVQRYAIGEDADDEELARVGFYDVFYPQEGGSFTPLFAFFERAARAVEVESAEIQSFKVAQAMPFFMIWWPDPAVLSLGPLPDVAAASASWSLPLTQYGAMGGRTSYYFVVPMMPPL